MADRRIDRSSPPLVPPDPRERWAQVSALLDAALETPPDGREAFVRSIDDPDVRDEVARLLAAALEEAKGGLATGGAAALVPARSADGETPSALAASVAAALDGRYTIERELGRGGMAVVYLARDLRHGRRVALKLMRAELTAQVTTARFQREIALAAPLSHPHIVPLHDSGEAAGHFYYVMPYVDGESLRARLDRDGPLPVRDALRIAREVADALDYAHRHGVVHRDVKPENILLSDGHAVLADFGIARAVHEAATDALTASGLVVGTLGYMSPEQAVGDSVDGRSDVFSLGCVLYAMLAGQPPFAAPTPQAVIARTIAGLAPPVRTLRPTVDEAVERLVMTALAREQADRYQTAGELAASIAQVDELRAVVPPAPHTVAKWKLVGGGAVATVVLGAAMARIDWSPPSPPVVERTVQFTYAPELEYDPALSPNGALLAYGAGRARVAARLYVRSVRGGQATALTDSTIQTPMSPSWSPDGSRIAFHAADGIYVVSALGGARKRVVPSAEAPGVSFTRPPVHSPAWSPDGRVLAYATDTAIFTVHLDSNATRMIGRAHEPFALNWSHDGEWIAYTSGRSERTAGTRLAASAIVIMRVGDGRTIQLTNRRATTNSPTWMPDDRSVLFVSTHAGVAGIYWLPLNPDRTVAGEPVALPGGTRASSLSLSADGHMLVYATFRTIRTVWRVDVDSLRTQSMADATPVTRGDQLVPTLSVARNGRWLAYSADLAGNFDIYRMPLTGGEPDRLTDDTGDDVEPRWSRDGAEIAFQSQRYGNHDILVMNGDGTNTRRLTSARGDDRTPDWSPDGRRIVYAGADGVYVVERAADGTFGVPRRIVATSAAYTRWSPDNRYIAFVGADGAPRILPADGGEVRTLWPDTAGRSYAMPAEFRGGLLAWSDDAKQLYYRVALGQGHWRVWAVPLSGARRRLLFEVSDGLTFSGPGIAAEGHRLYFSAGRNESDIWLVTLRPQ